MKTSLAKGQVIKLKIESLAFGNGAGVARHDRMVVFVSGACPGDEVRAQISLVKKNFAEAEILEIVTASENRVEPTCPVAHECGGCTWQHVEYRTQLHQKDLIVSKALSPLINESTVVSNIIPSPSELHYRNRIQLHKNGLKWGYFKPKSSDLVAIEECPIAENDLNRYLRTIKAKNSLPETCRVEIQRSPSGNVEHMVTREERDELGFSQVNTAVNSLLVENLVTLTEKLDFHGIHDLYAGNGNFSFPLATAHPNHLVFSVELNSKAHQDAVIRSKNSDLPHLKLIHSSVEKYLKSAVINEKDLIVLDPPRAGLQKVALQQLMTIPCQHLLYISCDPMTLKRDLMELTHKAGFQLNQILPFDMFPHTSHMEVLVYLNR